ncbi:MAG: BON domain-containing protein [Pirellulales bacterium]|nr:BON domain-containing protein [Pirellulales bacterium]
MNPSMERTGTISSNRVAEAARARLRNHPHPPIQEISCECDTEGRLVLRGRLPSYYLKQLAQTAVARLPGVEQVLNETEVVRRTV